MVVGRVVVVAPGLGVVVGGSGGSSEIGGLAQQGHLPIFSRQFRFRSPARKLLTNIHEFAEVSQQWVTPLPTEAPCKIIQVQSPHKGTTELLILKVAHLLRRKRSGGSVHVEGRQSAPEAHVLHPPWSHSSLCCQIPPTHCSWWHRGPSGHQSTGRMHPSGRYRSRGPKKCQSRVHACSLFCIPVHKPRNRTRIQLHECMGRQTQHR